MFPMFPAGRPGIALLLLRISVAALFTTEAFRSLAGRIPSWGLGAIGLIAFLVCLGFLTSILSVCCGIFAAAGPLLMAGSDQRMILLALLNAAALALLGPGAYSVDARLFGRRVIVVSSGNHAGKR